MKTQTTGNALCPLGPFCPLNSKFLKKLIRLRRKEPNDAKIAAIAAEMARSAGQAIAA